MEARTGYHVEGRPGVEIARAVQRIFCAVSFFVLIASVVADTALAQPQLDICKPDTSRLGGPSSVQGQLSADQKKGLSPVNSSGKSTWSDIKDSLSSECGFSIGGDLNFLGQFSNGGADNRDAVGGVARLFGIWTIIGKGSPDTGAFHFKLESRHRLGTSIAPQGLGPALGYAGLTSVSFSDAGQLLTNLYWQQTFNNNQFAFVAGIVDTTDYLDVYNLVSPWTDFNNLVFSNNPTIPAPSQGLGTAILWRFGDHNYAIAGIADANGQPDDPIQGIKNLFDNGETFKHVEIGWYDTWETRFSDNYHLSAWQIDARSDAGIGGGWGLAVHGGRTIAERWTPFIRAGYANGGGAPVDRSVSVGTGYSVFDGRDQLGFGLNWSRSPQDTVVRSTRDQYTAEIFYRYQPMPSLQITPGLQYLVNPAYAPDITDELVVGLRVRIVF
ncbi:carbohydrate porin [Ruegeria atlantica]|uniref:carbohydrate porin n=1 Tax=Ruegeria atlantica TaxID=81569 RepID=UPI001479A2E0|nr:carbohydrate porin [Ruegeria atlantica]